MAGEETATSTGSSAQTWQKLKLPEAVHARNKQRDRVLMTPSSKDTIPLRQLGKEPQKVVEESVEEDLVNEYFRDRMKTTGAEKCVFLVLKRRGKLHWAIDVPIDDARDEVEAFRRIRSAWYNTAGLWKRFFPLRRVVRFYEIEIRFIHFARIGHPFLVLCTPYDYGPIRQDIEKRRTVGTELLQKMYPTGRQEDFDYCSRGRRSLWEHLSNCPSEDSNNRWNSCPFMNFEWADLQSQALLLLPVLEECFARPEIAQGQYFLRGLSGQEMLRPYYTIGLSEAIDEPRISHQTYPAYCAEEGWCAPQTWGGTFGLFLLASITSIAILKVVFRSWDLAFEAGSFIAAVITIAITVGANIGRGSKSNAPVPFHIVTAP